MFWFSEVSTPVLPVQWEQKCFAQIMYWNTCVCSSLFFFMGLISLYLGPNSSSSFKCCLTCLREVTLCNTVHVKTLTTHLLDTFGLVFKSKDTGFYLVRQHVLGWLHVKFVCGACVLESSYLCSAQALPPESPLSGKTFSASCHME